MQCVLPRHILFSFHSFARMPGSNVQNFTFPDLGFPFTVIIFLVVLHFESGKFRDTNTQQLSLGFSGSLLPRPSRDTLREGGMGQEKLTIVFNALAG